MEKIWLQSYPNGVPARHRHRPHPVARRAVRARPARRYADKVAYISMGRAMTYGQLDAKRATAFAGWLQAKGAEEGRPRRADDA